MVNSEKTSPYPLNDKITKSQPVKRSKLIVVYTTERASSVASPSVWKSLPADLRLELTLQLFLNANLKVTCFILFLLSNFLRF